MWDSRNSLPHCQSATPVKDHSLAAHFSQWYPVNNVYAQSLHAVVAQAQTEDNDWRTIGDDDPKPAPKQYTLGSIKHVTFQGKHNSVDDFPVKAGDVVTAISQFSWAAVQMVKFGYGDLIGYCWLSDLEEVAA